MFSAPTAPVANVNDAPTGAPTLSDTTPTEGRALTVDTDTIVDSDGTTAAVTAGAFIFQWQQSADGVRTWTDIAGATGPVVHADPGASRTDAAGSRDIHRRRRTHRRRVMSAATDVVGDLFLDGAAADT